MKHAFVAPMVTERQTVELARLGEAAGWDATFGWEAVYRHDAWATLAAAAMVTERIRLGTLLTPVAIHQPWQLAARVGTVDRLSGGRVTMGVGLGAPNANWLSFLPDEGRRVRAEKVDEGLAIWSGLLAGQPFSYAGRHWSVEPVTELAPPPPVQRPHPPVWCVGALVPERERQPSLERAARWQGIFPAVAGGEGNSGLSIEALREIVQRVQALRAAAGLPWDGYEVAVEGDTHGDFGTVHGDPQAWARAGATWWVESWWDLDDSDAAYDELVRRVEAGPRR